MYKYNLELVKDEDINRLNSTLSYVKGNPIYNVEDMIPHKNILFSPMDKEWKHRIQSNSLANGNNELMKLRSLLLSFGGEEVNFLDEEEDLQNILKRGQLYYGDKVHMMVGEPCKCHSNSCYCWDANRKVSRICTGYAVNEDGLWRQHSWVINQKDSGGIQIIETTTKRLLYFGFVMTYKECENFLNSYI